MAPRRLRLHLFTSYSKRTQPRPTSIRVFSSSSRLEKKQTASQPSVTNDYEKRIHQLNSYAENQSIWYPNLSSTRKRRTPINQFRREYEDLKQSSTATSELHILAGRVWSVRTFGVRLLFFELSQAGRTVQVIVSFKKLFHEHNAANYDEDELQQRFKKFSNTIRKGDYWKVQGHAHRTASDELSLQASSLPTLLSPSLHQIPRMLDDAETKATKRHVDMLVNQKAVQTLRVRHLVEKGMKDYFDYIGFTAVHTPLLTAGAGGAVARPFETTATELSDQTLNLRIAPELWLKRLVVGGMERVYEMGPAFRNEGVDATHNPEFYIFEFYEAFATLDDLMQRTEKLLSTLSEKLAEFQKDERLFSLPPVLVIDTPFHSMKFIPTLESQLGQSLPQLDTETALEELLEIFKANDVQPPSKPTLPRLLDALSSHYLEPLCREPTFITHHPACLSPLSKHETCTETGQIVSLRAELFIGGHEIANMYEEENSPFEQRKKFEEQLKYRDVDGEGDRRDIDESYLRALEWGLPPTGGWGCGIDRLVMLFTGRERIGDVLPFGTLRNVVGASK
ncbi:mitochondrial lysine-tRNA synthetase [Saxophila tyrrhenica]|uniref:Lysyl-tRNA synthetase n=1 Tax=Saxophila tyrrhenica TaxID=1690608 RepID=A0AAV9PEK4_9PEZI|nr:mitochondrial lysine-tRNA synthetase [Saxophila tyrrhenica]